MFALLSFVGLFLNFYCRCDPYTMLISNNSCSVRYSYLDQIARNVKCTAVKEANSLCGREIRVLYSNLRPYIYLEDGNVTGILPGRSFIFFIKTRRNSGLEEIFQYKTFEIFYFIYIKNFPTMHRVPSFSRIYVSF